MRPGDTYVSGGEARRILGVTSEHLCRLTKLGLIGVRRFPASDPRYRLADLEALVASCTVPASAQAPEHQATSAA